MRFSEAIRSTASIQLAERVVSKIDAWLPPRRHRQMPDAPCPARSIFSAKFFVFPAKLGEQGKARLRGLHGETTAHENLFENPTSSPENPLAPRGRAAVVHGRSSKALATDAWIPPVRGKSERLPRSSSSRSMGRSGSRTVSSGRTRTRWRIRSRCGCHFSTTT